jgi:putative chitinase
MQITAAHIKSIFPQYKHPADLAECLTEQFEKYEITTVNRAAGFLAQCGHESAGFTVLKENLNYSADGLNKIFKKYFPTVADATPYARNPEKIANKVYANRMGNGPESSGDGYKFRGRGAIQLTGHDNYTQFAKSVGLTVDEAVADLETLDGAIESACWFWKKNGLNAICDADDIVKMTKRINGGTIGLEDRKKHYEHAKHLLGGGHVDEVAETREAEDVEYVTVRLGSNNATVKAVQKALGLTADGAFGPGTEKAVKAWQTAHGLAADGIVGPATIKKMLGQ